MTFKETLSNGWNDFRAGVKHNLRGAGILAGVIGLSVVLLTLYVPTVGIAVASYVASISAALGIGTLAATFVGGLLTAIVAFAALEFMAGSIHAIDAKQQNTMSEKLVSNLAKLEKDLEAAKKAVTDLKADATDDQKKAANKRVTDLEDQIKAAKAAIAKDERAAKVYAANLVNAEEAAEKAWKEAAEASSKLEKDDNAKADDTKAANEKTAAAKKAYDLAKDAVNAYKPAKEEADRRAQKLVDDVEAAKADRKKADEAKYEGDKAADDKAKALKAADDKIEAVKKIAEASNRAVELGKAVEELKANVQKLVSSPEQATALKQILNLPTSVVENAIRSIAADEKSPQ